MNPSITAALHAADTILKGASAPTVTAAELQAAMVALATAERRAGETAEAAYVRLLVGPDPDARMQKLHQATDAVRPGVRRRAIADIILRTEHALHKHVEASTKVGETVAQCYTRLMDSGDSTFAKYARALESARVAHDNA